MPEPERLDERIAASAGLPELLDEARTTWHTRAGAAATGEPGWRSFEDAFPTFYQFTNRPR